MWYEVLPSMGLVLGFLMGPQIVGYVWNHLTLNRHNEWKMWTHDEYFNRDYFAYMRDRRCGSRYYLDYVHCTLWRSTLPILL